jgi:hypothetical protein
VVGLTAVVMVPLVVALAALRTPRWYPLLDFAWTEMRVRDVGTAQTPLVGLFGRLSSNGNPGSHPGPISFWSLAPFHRLLGGSAWGLMVGVVVLNATAVGLTIWAALRRGGAVVALGFAAGLAALMHLYGTHVLTEPWNPYMPVMWWMLTLVGLWAVLCDDLPMLPVTVVAASFALQTHISYAVLVAGLTALAVVAGVRRFRALGDDPAGRRRLVRWSAVAAGLGVVLWTPTLVDQITGDPGNLSVVVEHFRHPEDETIGVAAGVELLFVQLNPWRLLTGQFAVSGSVVPGVALVAAWAASVVGCRRLPASVAARSTVLRLHLVVGAALALALVSVTRILGFVWFYLALWVWAITTLAVIATVWSAVLAVQHRRGTTGAPAPATTPRARFAHPGVAVLAAGLVAWTAWFALDAANAEPIQPNYSAILAEFTEAVTAAIDAGEVPGGGADGSYLVTWGDEVNLGSVGFGLANELEREGYDVGVAPPYSAGARSHRVMEEADATAEIHVSFGPDIAVWDAREDAERLAWVDPRTDEERADDAAVRRRVVAGLEDAGLDDLVDLVDTAPFRLYLHEDLPDELVEPVGDSIETGAPAAVYVAPAPAGGDVD